MEDIMRAQTIAFSILLLTFFITTTAFARVDIIPRMVVIENRERSGEITILNLSDKEETYSLKTLNYKQDTAGVYKTLEEPLSPLFDPTEVLRMSPRTFTLPPMGKQKVRLSFRRPADLPDGEYRFHILAIADKKNQTAQKADKKVSIGVGINLGISIPIIVRQGDLSAAGKLENIVLKTPSETKSKKPEVTFKAVRSGTASTLGRIDVAWRPQGGEWDNIGFITNFNLFDEINERYGSIALEKMPLGTGELRLSYTDTDNGTLYDEIVLQK
jgi:P pilus assembly chaperone PapD